MMNILITAGSTKEFIDSVRYISNVSTGQTGLFLAQTFIKLKHSITLLMASDVFISDDIHQSALIIPFTTYRDIQKKLSRQLSLNHFDAVIHLAAIGDYYISDVLIEGHNIERTLKKITACPSLTLQLKQNPKLLPQIKGLSQNKNVFVVGFKLTDTDDPQEEQNQINEILRYKNIDVIVHNRLSEVKDDNHKAEIYKNKKLFQTVDTKSELAKTLLKILG